MLDHINAHLLTAFVLVNSVRIKSAKQYRAKVYLIVHLVAYLGATSLNASLFYCTNIPASFMIELLGTL